MFLKRNKDPPAATPKPAVVTEPTPPVVSTPTISDASISRQGLVLDTGSFNSRIGWGGGDAPTDVRRTLVYNTKEWTPKRLEIYPIVNGVIEKWDKIEELWKEQFAALPSSEGLPILLTEPTWNPPANREKALELFIEKYGRPAVGLRDSASLALYAAGLMTGVTVDIGDSGTTVIPIFNGHPIASAVRRNRVGGDAVQNRLAQLLIDRGYSFSTRAEREIIRDIKHCLGYIVPNFEEAMKTAAESSCLSKSYELPDGQVITITHERFSAAEVLFNPSLGAKCKEEKDPISLVVQAIQAIQGSFKDDLNSNLASTYFESLPTEILQTVSQYASIPRCAEMYDKIVISGASSMFPGIDTRFNDELHLAAPNYVRYIKIRCPPERKISAWIGGSILTTLSTFTNFCVSKEEYQESGAKIIHSRVSNPL